MTPTPRKRGAAAGLVAGLFMLVFPDGVLAWGPGTHLYLGAELLRHLDLLGPGVAALLSTRPRAFLYGSLAPDFLVAKDRAPADRHSHRWECADEVRRAARGETAREAAALGYLTHLAADVAAHGVFLPRRMVFTASTRSIGHSYWEHRVELALPDRYAEEARRLVPAHENGSVEDLFREVLTPTVFSFETNRRIFREMVRWSNHAGWQTLFGHLVDRSRWSLEHRERHRALDLSLSLSVDILRHGADSRVRRLDPIGRNAMERAKEIRRSELEAGPWNAEWNHPDRLRMAGDRHFPLPAVRGPADARGLNRLIESLPVGRKERKMAPSAA